MKIYVVLDNWNTHFGNSTNIEVFTDRDCTSAWRYRKCTAFS